MTKKHRPTRKLTAATALVLRLEKIDMMVPSEFNPS
jgi:hypothetical protein